MNTDSINTLLEYSNSLFKYRDNFQDTECEKYCFRILAELIDNLKKDPNDPKNAKVHTQNAYHELQSIAGLLSTVSPILHAGVATIIKEMEKYVDKIECKTVGSFDKWEEDSDLLKKLQQIKQDIGSYDVSVFVCVDKKTERDKKFANMLMEHLRTVGVKVNDSSREQPFQKVDCTIYLMSHEFVDKMNQSSGNAIKYCWSCRNNSIPIPILFGVTRNVYDYHVHNLEVDDDNFPLDVSDSEQYLQNLKKIIERIYICELTNELVFQRMQI